MRYRARTAWVFLSICTLLSTAWADDPSRTLTAKTEPKTNKLLYMYRMFYLPFSVEFREGRGADEILPFVTEGGTQRLLSAAEMIQLDSEWKQMREGIRPKALILGTLVPEDGSVKITQKLISHKIPVDRSAYDRIPISERVAMAEALRGKPESVKISFRQLQYVKSFTKGLPANQFHFFVVSPSWCNSSREYRMLFETYFKRFPQKDFVLHSIVIEDPKEKIFESKALAELFPHKELYSHDNVPKFLALDTRNGKTLLLEEGQALEEVFHKFFGKNRGHLDSQTTLFKARGVAKTDSLTPTLSGVTK